MHTWSSTCPLRAPTCTRHRQWLPGPLSTRQGRVLWCPLSPTGPTAATSRKVPVCPRSDPTRTQTPSWDPGPVLMWPGFRSTIRVPSVWGLGPALPSLAPGRPAGFCPHVANGRRQSEDPGHVPTWTATPVGTAGCDPGLGSQKSPPPPPWPWLVRGVFASSPLPRGPCFPSFGGLVLLLRPRIRSLPCESSSSGLTLDLLLRHWLGTTGSLLRFPRNAGSALRWSRTGLLRPCLVYEVSWLLPPSRKSSHESPVLQTPEAMQMPTLASLQ